MSDFLDWLTGNAHTDEQVRKLADLAKSNPDAWKNVANESQGRQVIENDKNLSASDKKSYLQFVSAAWSAFNSRAVPLTPPKVRQRLTQFAAENAPVVIIGVLAIGLVGFLVRAILDDQFLKTLAEIEVARGLITFFFALGTVGVAIILVTAVFTSEGKDLKDRFDMGKQVLTALIGILGTIVGFYFGAELAEKPQQPANPTETSRQSGDAAQSVPQQASQTPADETHSEAASSE